MHAKTTMNPQFDRLMQAAVAAHQRGDLKRAAAGYRQALAVFPGHPDALHLSGLVAYQDGRLAAAVEHVQAAIARHPGEALYHFNLGRILADAGDRAAALAAYGEALRLRPDYPEAAANRATLLVGEGRLGEAVACLDALVCRRPNDAAAWAHLAALLADAGRFDDAARCFERAAGLAPNDAVVLYRYGGMLFRAGRMEHAGIVLERAVALQPAFAEAHNRLAAVFLARQQQGRAEAALRTALELRPELSDAWLNLANLLAERGDPPAEVMAAYHRAGALCRPAALGVLEALLIPPILAREDDADTLRATLDARLDRLLAAPPAIADPLHEIGRTGLFYLAYHGRCDRALYEKVARLFLAACPALGEVAPHCRPAAPPAAGRRIRVGFVSAFFCDHTIGVLFKDLLAGFNRQHFEVVAVFAPGLQDAVSRAIAEGCEQALRLQSDLAAARAAIAGLELDVLVYPDVGMDPFTYFLAFARLAPLQCATWGHPATTGLPQIDVFFSSRHQERVGAQADYSEELVLLDNPLYVRSRPSLPGEATVRSALGLAGGHLYLCPQSLFKIQPQFDPILAAILRRDPEARIALPEGKFPQWRQRLHERFRRTAPDVADRLVFTPRLAHAQYLDLLAGADVMLDSLPFGGGLTTLDALAVGTPIVTWPGALMSSRFTSTCYERMGWRDGIATSAEDYVDKAVAFATAPELRRRARAQILAANSVLYDNPGVVRELEDFFAERARR